MMDNDVIRVGNKLVVESIDVSVDAEKAEKEFMKWLGNMKSLNFFLAIATLAQAIAFVVLINDSSIEKICSKMVQTTSYFVRDSESNPCFIQYNNGTTDLYNNCEFTWQTEGIFVANVSLMMALFLFISALLYLSVSIFSPTLVHLVQAGTNPIRWLQTTLTFAVLFDVAMVTVGIRDFWIYLFVWLSFITLGITGAVNDAFKNGQNINRSNASAASIVSAYPRHLLDILNILIFGALFARIFTALNENKLNSGRVTHEAVSAVSTVYTTVNMLVTFAFIRMNNNTREDLHIKLDSVIAILLFLNVTVVTWVVYGYILMEPGNEFGVCT